MSNLTINKILHNQFIRDSIRDSLDNPSYLKQKIHDILESIVTEDDDASKFRLTIIFDNTLYFDEQKNLYLLQSELTMNLTGEVIGSYLQIIDSDGNIFDEYIDDVWSYGNWKEIQ